MSIEIEDVTPPNPVTEALEHMASKAARKTARKPKAKPAPKPHSHHWIAPRVAEEKTIQIGLRISKTELNDVVKPKALEIGVQTVPDYFRVMGGLEPVNAMRNVAVQASALRKHPAAAPKAPAKAPTAAKAKAKAK